MTTILQYIYNLIKEIILYLFFFLRLDNFFFFFFKIIKKKLFFKNLWTRFEDVISQEKKSNNSFVAFLMKYITIIKNEKSEINSLILFSTTNIITSISESNNLLFILNKKQQHIVKKPFINLFSISFVNNIIFELENLETDFYLNSNDSLNNFYNENFFIQSTLYNYNLFQSRLITNEISLFDTFFFISDIKELNKKELGLYEFFCLQYFPDLYTNLYNVQLIHSKDFVSLRNFFSLAYYDYFKIQQDVHLLFNPVNILDDFRGSYTVIQLNNNLFTQNIENYILNLQKFIYNEDIIFFNTKINYFNYKFILLFYNNLLTKSNTVAINSLSLFEQNSLAFSLRFFNLFFSQQPRKIKLLTFLFYSILLILCLASVIFLLSLPFFEIFFLLCLLSSFLFVFFLHRFYMNYEIKLFGYSKISNKLMYEKIYLSDYKVTQYDDIYYYQQKYTMQRDADNRKTSKVIQELDFNINYDNPIIYDFSTNFFNNNLSELLFINFYESLYNFESDWKDNELDDLQNIEMDRIELDHDFPLELFISKVTERHMLKKVQRAGNTDDLSNFLEELDDILDREDTVEGQYDMLTQNDYQNIEQMQDDLSEFFDSYTNSDFDAYSFYALSGSYFSSKQRRTYNVELDTDSILNHDLPETMSDTIEEEFLEPENSVIISEEKVFLFVQKKVQKKIFQTIYFELLEEKEYLIKYYNLFFLLHNKKPQMFQLVLLQDLLKKGQIPLWILNTNAFYNELKQRSFNWYQQLLSTKKVYNDFTLALLNLEQYYTGDHKTFVGRYELYIEFFLYSVGFFPSSFLIFNEVLYYFSVPYEYAYRNYSSSIFAYNSLIANCSLTNFLEDQNLVDVLEHIDFSKNLIANSDNVPVQVDFFNYNYHIMAQLLNTLNSNLYLLYCNNINLSDAILKNQIFIFQNFLEYTTLKLENKNQLSTLLTALKDVFSVAKLNTIYDIEFFFFKYFLKYFKLPTVIFEKNLSNTSQLLLLNFVNYYINKFNLYDLKLPTNFLELQRFLYKLQQYDIIMGLESFDSNNFIENQKMKYDMERDYNVPLLVFDKEYFEYLELDSYLIEEVLSDPKNENQFLYQNIFYIDNHLFIDDEIMDGDITKLPPNLPYTAFNILTSSIELKIPTIQQEKYLFPDYMFDTLYIEIADDSFDFEGFFL